jgi:hypothetical protein
MIEYLLFVASIDRAGFAVKLHAFQNKQKAMA